MSRIRTLLIVVWLAAMLPFTYGGCVLVFKSGDFDDTPDQEHLDDRDSSSRFVGVASQAVIDASSAADLAGGALAAGVSEPEPAANAADRYAGGGHTDNFRSLRLPLTLSKALRMIDLRPTTFDRSRQSVRTRRGTVTGYCGGWMDYVIQADYATGEFEGSLAFHDYCGQTHSLCGDVDADGSFDLSSGDPVTSTFRFERLTDHPMTFDGEIALDFSDRPTLATVEAYGEDAGSGKLYWMKDYSLNLMELPGRVEAEVFGRFYHPDHGYVIVSTNVPFVLCDGDDWPTTGELLIDGLNGTRAKLSTLSHGGYTVDADTEEDRT